MSTAICTALLSCWVVVFGAHKKASIVLVFWIFFPLLIRNLVLPKFKMKCISGVWKHHCFRALFWGDISKMVIVCFPWQRQASVLLPPGAQTRQQLFDCNWASFCGIFPRTGCVVVSGESKTLKRMTVALEDEICKVLSDTVTACHTLDNVTSASAAIGSVVWEKCCLYYWSVRQKFVADICRTYLKAWKHSKIPIRGAHVSSMRIGLNLKWRVAKQRENKRKEECD